MRTALCVLTSLMLAFWFSTAQETPSPDEQNYSEMRAWMTVEETERACGSLFYFELRAIDHNIHERMRRSPEYKNAIAASGSSSFDERFAEQKQMLEDQRAAAKAGVSDPVCDGFQNPVFAQARLTYFPDFLKFIFMITTEQPYDQMTAAQRDAMSGLFNFIKGAYGEQYDTTAQSLVDQLNAQPYPAGVSLTELKPYLDDVIWHQQLASKSYSMTHHSEDDGWYEFRKDGVPVAEYGKMGQPRRQQIRFDVDVVIPMMVASGRMSDDRIVFVTTFETQATAEVADPLKATIFSQDDAVTGTWGRSDWRSGATGFDALVDTSEACPGHICFIFPTELTDRIKERQAGDNFPYAHEIYISGAKMHPAPSEASRVQRSRFTPPRFVQ